MKWMSPELICPDDSRSGSDQKPTKESDCYALGMVTYEVLSGHAPFRRYANFIALQRILDGKRPGRPRGMKGAWFTDELWRMLKLCWATKPADRPSIEDVLECFVQVSKTWNPPTLQAEEGGSVELGEGVGVGGGTGEVEGPESDEGPETDEDIESYGTTETNVVVQGRGIPDVRAD